MRWLIGAFVLAVASPAAAFTVDFEQSHGFGAPGDALPASFATPFGDVEFIGGVLATDPLGPGSQMASPMDGSSFEVRVPAGVLDVRLVLVNPTDEALYVQHFRNVWDDCGGSPCLDVGNDFGTRVEARSVQVLVLPAGDFGVGGALFDGATRSFDDRSCPGSPTCLTSWGVGAVALMPEPTGATLFGVGLLSVAVGVRRRRGAPLTGTRAANDRRAARRGASQTA